MNEWILTILENRSDCWRPQRKWLHSHIFHSSHYRETIFFTCVYIVSPLWPPPLHLLFTSSSSLSIRAFLYSIVTWPRLGERELSAMNQFQAFFFLSASWQLMGCRRWPSVMRKGLRDVPAGGFSPRQANERAALWNTGPHCSGKFNLP